MCRVPGISQASRGPVEFLKHCSVCACAWFITLEASGWEMLDAASQAHLPSVTDLCVHAGADLLELYEPWQDQVHNTCADRPCPCHPSCMHTLRSSVLVDVCFLSPGCVRHPVQRALQRCTPQQGGALGQSQPCC